MLRKFFSSILIGSLFLLAGCNNTASVVRSTSTTTRPVNLETAKKDYLATRAADSEVYLDKHTMLVGTAIDSDDGAYGLTENIELSYESTGNGLFFYITNHNPVDAGVSFTIESDSFDIPYLMAGERRAVFAETDPNLLSNGFSINGDSDVNIVLTAKEPDGVPLNSDITYPLDTAQLNAQDAQTYASLQDKNYILFLHDAKIRDFNLKYYSGGNLIAGGSMRNTNYYDFSDSHCIAVKVPDEFNYDSVEMECFY